jgi:Transcriptional regulator
MNIANIEAFLAVVRYRNVTHAANSMFLTQSTMSNRLKSLENELEVSLFERRQGMRTIELTQKGKELVPVAEKWLELWEETKQLKNSDSRIDFTIGSPDTLNTCLLIPFYRDLTGNPGINLRIRTQQSEEVYEKLEEKTIDLGFTFRNIQYEGIQVENIFEDPFCIITREDSPYRLGKALAPSQLNTQDEIVIMWGDAFNAWHKQHWDASHKPRAIVDTPFLLNSLMDGSEFWSLCPVSVGRRLIAEGPFKMNPISGDAPLRSCYLLQSESLPEYKMPLAKKICALFRKHIKASGYELMS